MTKKLDEIAEELEAGLWVEGDVRDGIVAIDLIKAALQQAVDAEREACFWLCQSMGDNVSYAEDCHPMWECADAIRQRGEE